MFKRIFSKRSDTVHALRHHNVDYVLDNFLEPEVNRILLPLCLAQYLTSAPKYSIRYNFVTSNNFKTNAFILVSTACTSSIFVYILTNYLSEQIKLLDNQLLFLSSIICFIISCFLNFIINSVVTVAQTEEYSFLVINIRRIHNCLKLTKFDNNNIVIGNWIYVLCVVLYHIINFLTRLFKFNDSMLFNVLTQLFMYTEDCNVMVAGRILNLLGKQVNAWVSELSTVLSTYSDTADEQTDNRAKDLYMKRINQAYEELMEALDICQKLFGIPIAFFVICTFLEGLMMLNVIIETQIWNMQSVMIMVAVAKNFILLTLFSMTCENLCLRLKNAHVSSIMALDNNNFKDLTPALRMQARLTKSTREEPLLTACGLFPVHAALPLRLLAVLATYAVVVLQFYFL